MWKCNLCRNEKYCEMYCLGWRYEQSVKKTMSHKIRQWILKKLNRLEANKMDEEE